MNIVKIDLFLCFLLQWSSIGSETIEIPRNPGKNDSILVWSYDEIRIVQINDFVDEWSFDNQVIVIFDGTNFVTSATSPINVIGTVEGADSVLRLRGVNQRYTGVYRTRGLIGNIFLNLTVHSKKKIKEFFS